MKRIRTILLFLLGFPSFNSSNLKAPIRRRIRHTLRLSWISIIVAAAALVIGLANSGNPRTFTRSDGLPAYGPNGIQVASFGLLLIASLLWFRIFIEFLILKKLVSTRQRKSRCIECGHQLIESQAKCPECGTEIKKASPS